jgi:hypothetical protein
MPESCRIVDDLDLGGMGSRLSLLHRACSRLPEHHSIPWLAPIDVCLCQRARVGPCDRPSSGEIYAGVPIFAGTTTRCAAHRRGRSQLTGRDGRQLGIVVQHNVEFPGSKTDTFSDLFMRISMNNNKRSFTMDRNPPDSFAANNVGFR